MSKSNKAKKSTPTAKAKIAPKKTKAPPSISAPLQAGLAAVEAMPHKTKKAIIIELLMRPEGATLADMTAATGWQKHTVRGQLSGALRKKLGYQIVSDKPQDGQRIYKIAGQEKDDH